VIESIRQGLKEDGFEVSISKLCQWFDVSRRTFYYRSVKAKPKVKARYAEPIKAMIEENPSFGYRTVAHLLQMNKNTVQRIFQLRRWQVKKRPTGFRPRIELCLQLPLKPMNVGLPIFAAFGPVEMVG
jgi:putative transposase